MTVCRKHQFREKPLQVCTNEMTDLVRHHAGRGQTDFYRHINRRVKIEADPANLVPKSYKGTARGRVWRKRERALEAGCFQGFLYLTSKKLSYLCSVKKRSLYSFPFLRSDRFLPLILHTQACGAYYPRIISELCNAYLGFSLCVS